MGGMTSATNLLLDSVGKDDICCYISISIDFFVLLRKTCCQMYWLVGIGCPGPLANVLTDVDWLPRSYANVLADDDWSPRAKTNVLAEEYWLFTA